MFLSVVFYAYSLASPVSAIFSVSAVFVAAEAKTAAAVFTFPFSTEEQVSSAKQSIETAKEELIEARDTSKSRAWWVWVILIVLAILGLIGCCGFIDGEAVWLGFIGLALLALSILCMIWPSAFWWFIWWYY